jgi:hypothetical protein
MLNLILNQQIGMMDRAAGIGAQQIVGAMVPLIRNTLAKMVNAAGFKNPDMYFPEVGPEIMQALQQAGQGGQDAEAQAKMQKAQADMQIEQAKMQADVQLSARTYADGNADRARKTRNEPAGQDARNAAWKPNSRP